MTNEEFNRKVEFLLSQQAKFDARMQKAEETQGKHERRIDETAELSRKIADGLSDLISVTAHLTNAMVDCFRSLFELAESNKHTDERIDALINSQIRADERFESHLREDHRGPNGAEN